MRPTRRAVLGGMLAAPLTAPLIGATGRSRGSTAGPKLIVVNAYGGWDTTLALDPKPGVPAFDAPPGEVRNWSGIDVLSSPDRPAVDAFFERAASFSTVIKGISVESLSHPQCTRRILTGTYTAGAPDVAAIAASELGADRPLPYLVASPAAFAGPFAAQPAHAGATNQLAALADPELEPPPLDPEHTRFAPSDEDEEAIVGWLRARASSEAATRGLRGENARRVADYRWSLDRAEQLEAYKDVFVGGGGRPATFQDRAYQACRALSQGLSWAVTLDSGLDFDTHEGNNQQVTLHQSLFAQLGTLLTYLEETWGEKTSNTLLDETLVVVISEMTRTPRLTPSGGKDHWPFATVLMFGAGIRGGTMFGDTGPEGIPSGIDHQTGEVGDTRPMLEPAGVLAGLLELSGVDPAPFFPGSEVFRAFLA